MNYSLNTKELVYSRNANTFENFRGDIQELYYRFCLIYFEYFQIGDLDLVGQDRTIIRNNKEEAGRDLIIKSLYLEEEAKKRELEESNKVQALSFSKKHSRAQSSISTSLESSNIIKKLKLEELYSYTSSTGFDNNLDLLLKEFLDNSQAGYKSREQKALVKATLARVSYIVAIIATNRGKSLSYLLTSSLSNFKVSIVIIPLVGLKLDIQKQALEFNIPTLI
jgi:hypothetical protein